MTIDGDYFKIAEVSDRKNIPFGGDSNYTFGFDYLSYLLFEVNIDEKLPSFYTAVETIIENKLFNRDEDISDIPVTVDNDLDDATKQIIFSQI